jgi:PAS domain S-box-containing protein
VAAVEALRSPMEPTRATTAALVASSTTMTGILLVVIVMQAAGIVALLVYHARLRRAERGLRKSEERFRLIADRAPVILWTARPDTTLDFVNGTSVEFSGLPLDHLLDERWLSVVHPEDVEHAAGIYVPAFEARQPFLMEYRLRRADGAYRWFLASGVPKYGVDRSFDGYIGCSIDITERKEAEDRIRENRAALELSHREIQNLAGRLIEAQDIERARVARDLHDDVSQQLAAMSIALSRLRQRMGTLGVGDDLREDVQALQQRTGTLAQNVRDLSHDLHPTVLRHAGLVPALTAHCTALEGTHDTVVTCRAEGDFDTIAPEAALCLYRVAQEALRNVTAHAGASRAEVRLVRTGDLTELTITDDGKGFDMAGSLERGKGLGLVSITERVRLVGGTVSIVPEVNRGTRVSVQIPASAPMTSGAGAAAAGHKYSPT